MKVTTIRVIKNDASIVIKRPLYQHSPYEGTCKRWLCRVGRLGTIFLLNESNSLKTVVLGYHVGVLLLCPNQLGLNHHNDVSP